MGIFLEFKVFHRRREATLIAQTFGETAMNIKTDEICKFYQTVKVAIKRIRLQILLTEIDIESCCRAYYRSRDFTSYFPSMPLSSRLTFVPFISIHVVSPDHKRYLASFWTSKFSTESGYLYSLSHLSLRQLQPSLKQFRADSRKKSN